MLSSSKFYIPRKNCSSTQNYQGGGSGGYQGGGSGGHHGGGSGGHHGGGSGGHQGGGSGGHHGGGSGGHHGGGSGGHHGGGSGGHHGGGSGGHHCGGGTDSGSSATTPLYPTGDPVTDSTINVPAADGRQTIFNVPDGNVKVIGTTGDDMIIGGVGNEVIYGNGGNDMILGGTGNDSIYGGNGNNVLLGGAGSDIIHGGSGTNIISGGTGDNVLYGGAGNNTFTYDSRLYTTDGSPFSPIVAQADYSGPTTFLAGGNDIVHGGTGSNDTITLAGYSKADWTVNVTGGTFIQDTSGNFIATAGQQLKGSITSTFVDGSHHTITFDSIEKIKFI